MVSKMVPGAMLTLRRPIFSFLLAVLCCGFARSGQVSERQISPAQPAQNLKKYTLTGVVVNSATGEPIRRALVHVNGPGQFTCFSGSDGRFEIGGIPEGQVFVSAEKPGFFDQQTSHPGFYPFRMNAVTIGPGTNEVRVQLIPESRIRGRIVDSEGEPVPQVSIQLFSEEIIEGRKQIQSPAGMTTDEDGAFQFDGLTPGRYFLHSAAHPVESASWTSRSAVFAPQYYPQAPDRSTAQPIDLKAGEQLEADLTVHEVPAFTISGIIAGAQNGVGMSFEERGGQRIWMASLQFDQRTGQFVVRGVPSGSWTLSFNSNDSQGNVYYARQDVTVNGSDVSGVQVLLQRAPDISVVVNRISSRSTAQDNVGGAQQPLSGMQVQLISTDNISNQRFYAAPQSEEVPGLQCFRAIPPGRYKVLAQSFGPECVESMTMGNVDLSRTELLVAPGSKPEPIVISLRNDCASVTGTIRPESPSVQAFAVLVPDSLPDQPQMITTQPNGSFSFGSLRPGSYRVYVFSNLQGLEYANPEVLNSYSGQQITIAANEKASVTVDLFLRKTY